MLHFLAQSLTKKDKGTRIVGGGLAQCEGRSGDIQDQRRVVLDTFICNFRQNVKPVISIKVLEMRCSGQMMQPLPQKALRYPALR